MCSASRAIPLSFPPEMPVRSPEPWFIKRTKHIQYCFDWLKGRPNGLPVRSSIPIEIFKRTEDGMEQCKAGRITLRMEARAAAGSSKVMHISLSTSRCSESSRYALLQLSYSPQSKSRHEYRPRHHAKRVRERESRARPPSYVLYTYPRTGLEQLELNSAIVAPTVE